MRRIRAFLVLRIFGQLVCPVALLRVRGRDVLASGLQAHGEGAWIAVSPMSAVVFLLFWLRTTVRVAMGWISASDKHQRSAAGWPDTEAMPVMVFARSR